MAEKFTAEQFIKAIPGSGGIVSVIAAVVHCDWHTARKYIDEHPTVKQAWDDERKNITDKAKHNILKAINEGDLQMSKWWLSVMDEEFIEKSRRELSGVDGNPITVKVEYVEAPKPD